MEWGISVVHFSGKDHKPLVLFLSRRLNFSTLYSISSGLENPMEHRDTRKRQCFFRNFGGRKIESLMEGVELDTSYRNHTKIGHSLL